MPRCFVGLWPDPAARAALGALALRVQQEHPGAKPLAPADLHLTLAFLGAIDPSQAAQAAAALAALSVEPFTWTIDRLGAFAGPRVGWAAGPPDAALEALAAGVRATLQAHQLPFDQQPFRAHVTLLRGVRGALQGGIAPAILWPVHRPVLIESLVDAPASSVTHRVRYRTWPAP